jgi:hypothetical protein
MKLSGWCLAFAALTFAGCSWFDDTEVPKLALETQLSPAEARIGDTVRVVIEVRNISNDVVRVGQSHCNSDFVITSAGGWMYHPAEQIYCSLALYAATPVAPGETLRIDGFTTARVIPKGTQSEPVYLEPGSYEIRAVVAVSKQDEDAVIVRSSPASIVLHARQ